MGLPPGDSLASASGDIGSRCTPRRPTHPPLHWPSCWSSPCGSSGQPPAGRSPQKGRNLQGCPQFRTSSEIHCPWRLNDKLLFRKKLTTNSLFVNRHLNRAKQDDSRWCLSPSPLKAVDVPLSPDSSVPCGSNMVALTVMAEKIVKAGRHTHVPVDTEHTLTWLGALCPITAS